MISVLIFDLQGYCRRVICPRDYYVLKGKCVPLYRSITGVDINVKIEIALKDENPTELFSDVLIKLRKIVNISLANFVTLQSREMSVWYGPKGSKDRDKYFMFDIFLFNSSGTIDISASLNEIRNFYNNLKAQDSIRLLNDDEKKLEINFNDRVIPKFRHRQYNDMSINGDGSLRILVGRKLEELHGRPSLLVSNVNWCYRVPFDTLDETVMIGNGVYFIKPADIIVYKNQLDKINKVVPEKIHLLYLCLDLFISHIDERNSDKTSYDPTRLKSNTDDENIDMTFSTIVNIIITAVALGLCLVCALCKIHYTSMKPTVQSVIQASPDMEIVSNVGMTEDGTHYIEMAENNLDLDTNADADASETEPNSKDVPDIHYQP